VLVEVNPNYPTLLIVKYVIRGLEVTKADPKSSQAIGSLSQGIFHLGPWQTASSIGINTWPQVSPLLKPEKDTTLPSS